MIEIISVALAGALLGVGVMKVLLKIKKVEQTIDRTQKNKYKAMNDPELLLKKLNENGIMVDDGDEISFAIEEKDGVKQLVQRTKKNTVVSGSPTVKAMPKKKNGKAGKRKANGF